MKYEEFKAELQRIRAYNNEVMDLKHGADKYCSLMVSRLVDKMLDDLIENDPENYYETIISEYIHHDNVDDIRDLMSEWYWEDYVKPALEAEL